MKISNMLIVSNILFVIGVILLVVNIIQTKVKVFDSKARKKFGFLSKFIKSQKTRMKFKYYESLIYNKLKKLIRNLMSDYSFNQLEYKINTLKLDVEPEYIRFKQLVYAMGGLIIAGLLFKTSNIFLVILGLSLVPIGYSLPLSDINTKIKERDKALTKDFYSFYSFLYYQYSKKTSLYLSDIVKRYIPMTSGYMRRELELLFNDIEKDGELKALQEFSKRVRLPFVIRFVDIMSTRLQGYDNLGQMSYFKEELRKIRLRELQEELERKKKLSSRVMMVLDIIFLFYVLAYLLAESIKSIFNIFTHM